ncbi:hypothetical protein KC343_g23324, partial [Hortaea werneckii]
QQHMYQQPGYQSGPISAGQFQALGQRKKQMRATQACEQCRQRKQKCDEGSPCSFCKENNLSCQYRDTPPAKTDKNMERLLQYMESHGQGLSALTNKIDDMDITTHARAKMCPLNKTRKSHSTKIRKTRSTRNRSWKIIAQHRINCYCFGQA